MASRFMKDSFFHQYQMATVAYSFSSQLRAIAGIVTSTMPVLTATTGRPRSTRTTTTTRTTSTSIRAIGIGTTTTATTVTPCAPSARSPRTYKRLWWQSFMVWKLKILDVWQGVEFLGAYLKPWRRYVSNTCLHRMKRKLHALNESVSTCQSEYRQETFLRLRPSLNSFLGVLSHYRSKTLRAQLMCSMFCFSLYGTFDEDILHYCPLVCSC